MKKFFTIIGILCLGFINVFAQTVQVSGTVTDADDGGPLPGVTILIKGSFVGISTDVNGRYSLEVPANATLQFSFVGMTTQEIPVGDRRVIDVAMQSGANILDEVVVTALGISRERKSLGYAVQDVKADELTDAGQKNILNALSGKIAGVQITSQGGQIGASQNIVIRGNSSFGSNQPLFVIDGIPVTNDNATGSTINLGSGINDINPNDIESISVLKGGSAALYGMRAGNGVILINTKQGRREKGVVVTYDGEFTIDNVYGLPKYQNKYGQGFDGSEFAYNLYNDGESYQEWAEEESFSYYNGRGYGVNDDADESWGPRLDIGLKLPQFNSPVINGVRQATPWVSHPNNIKDFFVAGYTMGHTLSLSSTSDNSITRASIGYRDQTGTTPNTNLKRYSASVNNKYIVNRFVDFDVSANYVRTTSDNLPGTGYNSTNPAQQLMQWFGRQVDMKDLKANWDQKDELGEWTHYNWINEYHTNPYFIAYRNTTSYKRDRIFGKASLWFKPTDWLKFEGRLGIDYFNSDQLSRIEYDTDNPDGYFRDYNRHTMEFNADLIGYVSKNFGAISLNAMAGANFRDYDYALKWIGANQLAAPAIYTPTNTGMVLASESRSLRRSNSVYANVSVGWKNQFYVDVSARNDWDSTIEDNFFYPAVSGSWIVSETFPAIAQSDILSFAKLRGGWAQVGSATTPYRSGSYYTAEATAMRGTVLYRNPSVYPPLALRPEMVKTWEIGLEVYFLSNRLRLDAAYYSRVTTDQIMEVNVSSATGYNSMYVNAGKIDNKGVEIQLSGDILKSSNGFNWSAILNWAKDRSEIVDLYKELQTYQLGSSWQARSLAIPGKTWGTLRGTGFVYNDDGSIRVSNGGYISAQNDQDIGDVTPKWLAGFRNDFSYKGWTLGFLLDFRMGGDIYSVSQFFGAYTGIHEHTAKGDIRETGVILGKNYMTDKTFKRADGTVNETAGDPETFFSQFYSIAQLGVLDGSFLKLREAYLSYSLPRSVVAKTGFISGAKISLIGNNLALLWTHKSNLIGIDPESTTESGNAGVGFESNAYPPARSIGLKLGLTF